MFISIIIITYTMSLSEDDRLIYYGPINVNLYPVTGTFRAFAPDRVQQDERTPDNMIKALGFLGDLTYLNPVYVNHYVPCVPATGISLTSPLPDTASDKEPPAVAVPLLKLPAGKAPEESFRGIASGHRSAILVGKDGKFYRLKGCGNDLQGFVVQKTDGFIPNHGVRGSQFECTVSRELYFSYLVHKALRPFNMVVPPLPTLTPS